ncbi:hypothetical protein CPB86DRAFT_779625, partial [Serendipita vermifera]
MKGVGGKIRGGTTTTNNALASSLHRFGNHGLVQMRSNPKQTVSPLKRLRSGRAVVTDSPQSKLLLESSRTLPLLRLPAPPGEVDPSMLVGLLEGSDLSDLTESDGESAKEDDGDFRARKRVKRGSRRSRKSGMIPNGKNQNGGGGGGGGIKTPVNKAGRVRRKKARGRMGPKLGSSVADPSLGAKAETDMVRRLPRTPSLPNTL